MYSVQPGLSSGIQKQANRIRRAVSHKAYGIYGSFRNEVKDWNRVGPAAAMNFCDRAMVLQIVILRTRVWESVSLVATIVRLDHPYLIT